jgi:uncharacterized membrane protein YkvA (DUF1232 family)
MKLCAYNQYEHPLPYGTADPRPDVHAGLSLDPRAVAEFDALLHRINPDAPRADPDRIERLADWLVSLSPDHAEHVLDARLECVDTLRAMLADESWNTPPAMAKRLQLLFEYLDRDRDLIDDAIPLLGLLDDVLLIELSTPVFANEVAQYRDFHRYATNRHLRGPDPAHRHAWLRDRLTELHLMHHRDRVRESRYAPDTRSQSLFRVS